MLSLTRRIARLRLAGAPRGRAIGPDARFLFARSASLRVAAGLAAGRCHARRSVWPLRKNTTGPAHAGRWEDGRPFGRSSSLIRATSRPPAGVLALDVPPLERGTRRASVVPPGRPHDPLSGGGSLADAARKGGCQSPSRPPVRRNAAIPEGPVVGLITRPRDRNAAQPAPPPSLIPGAHQVPARATGPIMPEAAKVGMDHELLHKKSIARTMAWPKPAEIRGRFYPHMEVAAPAGLPFSCVS